VSRRLLLAIALLGIGGWWYSPVSPRVPALAASATGGPVACPPPPPVGPGAPPLQSRVPDALRPIALASATLHPLAGFSVDARVLSRRDYRSGREAEYSPTDLALGWLNMRDDAVLSRLRISQSSRWYRYRWQDQPPLPPDEIIRSSANMHMIPADAAAAAALARVDAGDDVRIDGWLVEVRAADGWRWRSSTSRADTGDGACEVVLVCSLSVRE
jgi:hypothetical protein